MQRYKLNNEAKMDLARIYWHGAEAFGESQAQQYYEELIQRFEEIAEAPYTYPAVDHIRDGYRRSVCGVDSAYCARY
jgi:toxin ParE1/3/4